MSLIIVAVIPAHNEETNIASIVRDLAHQTYPLELIIVVDDCSTDQTSNIVRSLKKEIPQLILLNNTIPKLRAGAINCALESLPPKRTDIILVVDADNRLDKHLAEEAVRSFEENKELGGVCSIAGVLKPAKKLTILQKLLWRLQKLEYAGFDAERTQSWTKVLILHGLCTAYNYRIVRALGGLKSNHLLEDYDMTLRLKEIGCKTIFNPRMKAWTNRSPKLKITYPSKIALDEGRCGSIKRTRNQSFNLV